MNSTTLILGTRGSELALTQTELTTQALGNACPEVTVSSKIIKTTGDLRPDLKLSEFNKGPNPVLDKGIFTKELETALSLGQIHAAVHSLKDVPTELREGFRITAVLPRAPVEDVLITRAPGGLAALPSGATVATSSVRRARQLAWMRPDLRLADIRGNVGTRLDKLAGDHGYDAIMLARAGLERLGLMGPALQRAGVMLYLETLNSRDFLPAASQGAVALETWQEEKWVGETLSRINCQETFLRITAEREFLHLLKAGCQTPVGLVSWMEGGRLFLKARVFSESNPEAAPAEAEASAESTNPKLAAAHLLKTLA